MLRPIALATAISGTLDILFAMLLTLAYDRQVPDMLRMVASGPFPAAKDMGTNGAVLGIAVHFVLMGIMATIFMAVVRQRPSLLDSPLASGIGFGLITYVVMNLIVVQLRFEPPFPPKPMSIATQLFAHIVLVGIPFALIAARTLPRPAFR